MDENESWELVWPPSMDGDRLLVEAVVEYTCREDLFNLHVKAFARISEDGLGIDEQTSLLEELRQKSGEVSEIFINEALSSVFDKIGTAQLGEDLTQLLLCSHIPSPDGTDETDHEIRAIELFQGCVWELTAMFVCELLFLVAESGGEQIPHPPSSCLCPTERRLFLIARLAGK